MREEIVDRYFNWMCMLISNEKINIQNYSRVLKHLYTTEFTWLIDLDANRADDGIELRYRFGLDVGIENVDIGASISRRPCSVLEMMVALSLRCEEDIMQETEERRVDKWFWIMMQNLDLDFCTNEIYDSKIVDYIVEQLLNRTYEENGVGGLVTLNNRTEDLRTVEIWYQMMWYLDAYLKGECK